MKSERIIVHTPFFTAHIEYTPARPAPVCYNHDSPNFSDCGDDEEIEISAIRSESGDDLTPIFDALDGWDWATKEVSKCLND